MRMRGLLDFEPERTGLMGGYSPSPDPSTLDILGRYGLLGSGAASTHPLALPQLGFEAPDPQPTHLRGLLREEGLIPEPRGDRKLQLWPYDGPEMHDFHEQIYPGVPRDQIPMPYRPPIYVPPIELETPDDFWRRAISQR